MLTWSLISSLALDVEKNENQMILNRIQSDTRGSDARLAGSPVVLVRPERLHDRVNAGRIGARLQVDFSQWLSGLMPEMMG